MLSPLLVNSPQKNLKPVQRADAYDNATDWNIDEGRNLRSTIS